MLPEDDVASFLEAFGGTPPPPELVRFLYAETEGNAFFLEEVVRLRIAGPDTTERREKEELLATVSAVDGRSPLSTHHSPPTPATTKNTKLTKVHEGVLAWTGLTPEA